MSKVNVLYTAHASANGGRDGCVISDDGVLNFKLGTPKELGGTGGELSNPEQLFAAGYSACFLSTIKVFASQANIDVPAESKVTAAVGVGPSANGYGLDVSLNISLPGMNPKTAQDLINKAHGACPYSNAIRGNVEVSVKLSS